MKQWSVTEKFRQLDPEGKIDYVIGGVRDKERVHRVMDGTDAAIDQRVEKIVALSTDRDKERELADLRQQLEELIQ